MGKIEKMLKDSDIISRSGKVIYLKENVSFLKDTKINDDAAPLIIKKKKNEDSEDTDYGELDIMEETSVDEDEMQYSDE